MQRLGININFNNTMMLQRMNIEDFFTFIYSDIIKIVVVEYSCLLLARLISRILLNRIKYFNNATYN